METEGFPEIRKMTRVIIIAAVLMHLSPCATRQSIEHVYACPVTEQTWAQRSSGFSCNNPHEVYHCIQNKNNTLVETCMTALNISSFKVGCPWVHIDNEKAFFGHPFHTCNAEDRGCPGKFHKKYPTNKLYMYPACILSDARTIPKKVTERTTKNLRRYTLEIHIGIFIAGISFSTLSMVMIVYTLHKTHYASIKALPCIKSMMQMMSRDTSKIRQTDEHVKLDVEEQTN